VRGIKEKGKKINSTYFGRSLKFMRCVEARIGEVDKKYPLTWRTVKIHIGYSWLWGV